MFSYYSLYLHIIFICIYIYIYTYIYIYIAGALPMPMTWAKPMSLTTHGTYEPGIRAKGRHRPGPWVPWVAIGLAHDTGIANQLATNNEYTI